MKLRFTIILFAVITFIFINSCKEQVTNAQNYRPKIESLSASPSKVAINQQAIMTCIATDEDGDYLTITWLSNTGTFPNGSTGSSVNWKASSSLGNFKITAMVSDGKTANNEEVNVRVEGGGTVPRFPTLSSPINGDTNVSKSPTLIWDVISQATSYTLQVSTSNQFTSIVYNQNELIGTMQQISGLNNGTIYYWRVSASNNNGASGWSEIWNFTTATEGET